MTMPRRRMIYLAAALSAWAIIIVIRLAQIQIVRHDDYVERARRQQERTISLTSVRGSILDARGRLLAESVSSRSLYADPQAIPDPQGVIRALMQTEGLDLDPEVLGRRLEGAGEFAWIQRQVDDAVYERIDSAGLSGVYSLEEPRRVYPNGALAASVLGWVGIDGQGLAGVEHSLDRFIRGRPGVVTLLRDAHRGMYLVGDDGGDAPEHGLNLILTIDEVIQYVAERSLQNAIETHRARSGSVIVMDPWTGDVLAMASWPEFDPNRFRHYPDSHWRNRTVQDLYEPGSTFKIVVAAAAIEEGLVTPSQLIDCEEGFIEVAGRRIREHDFNRYGLISFEDVLVHSSNVGTIKVGLSLGEERLYEWVTRFGFGEKTGIRLPGETAGILRATSDWSKLSNAVISIGQEIGVTPLQIAQATAIIANGGRRVSPRIVDRIVDADGNDVFEPEPVTSPRVISERTAAIMNEMLKAVVARGTGKNAGLEDHVVAGKTGTAQKAVPGGYSADRFVASFTGYVPADRPRLVILVVIDEPKDSHYGGTVAAPVFREIAEAALRYLEIDPATPRRELVVAVSPAPAPMDLAANSQKSSRVNSVESDAHAIDPRRSLR